MKRLILWAGLCLFLSGCADMSAPLRLQLGGADIQAIPGNWQGSYACRQGMTNLNLSLQANPNTLQVTGVFQFSAHPSNPNLPSGAYQVSGVLQGHKLYLRAGSWIQQPPNWYTLDVDGVIDTNSGRYSGKICGNPFELRKTSASTAMAPASAATTSSLPVAPSGLRFPMPGSYDGSDRKFERTLEIRPDGNFSIEVLEKGKPGRLMSGSGAGKLVQRGSGWQYTDGRCNLALTSGGKDLQVRVNLCASNWGGVPFDGSYQFKTHQFLNTGAAGSAQAKAVVGSSIPSTTVNARLAAQLNCQKLSFMENAAPRLLAQMAGVSEDKIWDREVSVPAGYTFHGLPIQTVSLSEADGGFLAIFAIGDQAALQAAIRKANKRGNPSTAILRKVGEPHGYVFPGKRAGQLYVECRS